MRRFLGNLTRDAVVSRARSAIGCGTQYRLGMGGRDPRAQHPGSRALLPGAPLRCDCSGFAAWCYGVDRYLPNGGVPTLPGGDWFETTNVWRDARSPFGFVAVIPWWACRPGDLLVYPDSGGRQGHIGIVATVGDRGDDHGPLTVVHCSAGNWRRFGDAIRETDYAPFAVGEVIAAAVAWVTD